jgi:predicted transcriptional regulator with HTH domain
MRSISAQSYYEIPDLEDRQRRVEQCIALYPGMSYRDIARKTRMDPNNVKSRITELLNQDRIIISGHKRDHKTNRIVRQYRVIR